MTSLPIATPSPDPPPRRRQANQRNGREPRPRWQTPEYDGPEEMLTLTATKTLCRYLESTQEGTRGSELDITCWGRPDIVNPFALNTPCRISVQ
ncbi:hypothetical protein R3P38DRAFT_3189715 [Favolaschia claudopus]|uniref:Uncharacterized protein n=1 Tax=Favolaschia claudopus TaxID=2862362 RepID=A0AAW0BNE3_9AGAR